MNSEPTDAQLLAFLEEQLPAIEAAALESRLRNDGALLQRLASLRAQEDQGLHSLGSIWRRFNLSCPSREELGQWLLEVMDAEAAEYLEFHIRRLGCRICQANLADLQRQAASATQEDTQRRRRFFQTSVGRLRS